VVYLAKDAAKGAEAVQFRGASRPSRTLRNFFVAFAVKSFSPQSAQRHREGRQEK
jgi:hypothetical protein